MRLSTSAFAVAMSLYSVVASPIGSSETQKANVHPPRSLHAASAWEEYNTTDLQFQEEGNALIGIDKYDYFGSSVAINGNGHRVAIGSRGRYGYDGAVFVYEASVAKGPWNPMGQVLEGEGGDFASSLDLNHDGTILVVGAPYMNGDKGAVKVYKFDYIWELMGEIHGEVNVGRAGHSVSISGDGKTIASGAPESNDGFGRVSMWKWNESVQQWKPAGEGHNIDGTQKMFLGGSVSVNYDGTRVVIGAKLMTPSIGGVEYEYGGGVEVYDFDNNSWRKNSETIHGDKDFSHFGHSVDISYSGNRIIVGAYSENKSSGKVFVFELDNTFFQDWKLLGQEILKDSEDSKLGSDVSISGTGDVIAISAPDNDQISKNSGKIEVFRFDEAKKLWVRIGMGISDYDIADDDLNDGDAIALSEYGDHVVIGSQSGEYYKGVAEIFKAEPFSEKIPPQIPQDLPEDPTEKLFHGDIVSIFLGALFSVCLVTLYAMRAIKGKKKKSPENIMEYIDEFHDQGNNVHVRRSATGEGMHGVYGSEHFSTSPFGNDLNASDWKHVHMLNMHDIIVNDDPSKNSSKHNARQTKNSPRGVTLESLAEENLSVAESNTNDDDSQVSFETSNTDNSHYYKKWYGGKKNKKSPVQKTPSSMTFV
ncbi:hypothetical protein CTEN210_15287 [Chaetoceros tenuissimus]|uniref:Uncharacterized protein n=1 Tax=Chaetoceros tenuissimus TaxID=426638 RepID=A0AAD3D6M4_9STRA|nr:hypothetical protein CTEN210_15287 [Chaetoceros tenuissimus]